MNDDYDEFGNYIGDQFFSDEESTTSQTDNANTYLNNGEAESESESESEDKASKMDIDNVVPSNAVVLHEDKQYYPSAQQTYGRDVETMVQEEDTQAFSQPIVAPVVQKKFHIQEKDLPETYFSKDFMTDLMNYPEHIRNVALAGQLHHGKTSFMDMLVLKTHNVEERWDKKTDPKKLDGLRYTDTHPLERERGLSVKATPISILLPSTKRKSHVLNIIDTPGHVNFLDEVACALRLTDGVVLIVDVVEGVQLNTEMIIKHAVLEDLPIVLVINKLDRLILELKIPPQDAYFKIKHVIEQVNTTIESIIPGKGEKKRLSPEKGNVLFASGLMRWCFTLQSFAHKYAQAHPTLDSSEFALRLWGNIYYNPASRNFTRKPVGEGAKRGFVHFILEPIYKLFSHTISQAPAELASTLASLGIALKPSQLRLDAKTLLKLVCEQFFGPPTGFVDMITQHIPSPIDGSRRYLERFYTGNMQEDNNKSVESLLKCDQDGPLVIHTTKLYNSQHDAAMSFSVFGRVLSGIARPGTEVKVLGDLYTPDDDDNMSKATIGNTWIAEGRYQIPTSGVPAGNWVLMSGVDNSIVKSSTIISSDNEEAHVFKPIQHFYDPVFKIAIEPIKPSELPKMLDGLRKINKSYPLVQTKVEESGEHIILGSGELYMDCLLRDLRLVYAEMDLKISDPVARFAETIAETSALKCYAMTLNQKNKITMIAEPLDPGIAEDIETGAVFIRDSSKVVGKFFETKYDYDILASRSIWAFGPDDTGPNILQNDTIPTEVDRKALGEVRSSICQGFSWASREGPLCEEPMRNTKFRLTDALLAPEKILRGSGQIIPTARRACYAAFLTAGPRLMEPVYRCSMLGPQSSIAAFYSVLEKRRGHVSSDGPVAGTTLYRLEGLIPVIDSFGFETDLRIHAQGLAIVSLVFDRWATVPGNPLDTTIQLRPLDPAPAQGLARDFMLKTRRRKGLAEEVSVAKFMETDMYKNLVNNGILD